MKHLQRDLEKAKREILAMGSLVERAISDAMTALRDRDPELARAVEAGDHAIDDKEIAIEEECLKILALHQPVAQDLRFIVAVLKVNNDLERMGDLAQSMARRGVDLVKDSSVPEPAGIDEMMKRVRSMVTRSLDSLVHLDPQAARDILRDDQAVDELHRKMYERIQDQMAGDPGHVRDWVRWLSVSRYLERIADLSTNIAEDIIFTVEGEVVRHGAWATPQNHS